MAEKQSKREPFAEPEVIYLINKSTNEQYMTDTKFGVVDWFINGKHYRRLEKRETKQTEKGPRTKSKGLALQDCELLKLHWPQVMQALGSRLPEDKLKPGAPAPATQPAPAAPMASARTSDF